jgi:transposase
MAIDGRSIPHEVLEHMRLSAVILRSEGVAAAVVARSFGVKEQTVHQWNSEANTKGVDFLLATKANGAPPAMPESVFKELLKALRKPASDHGYATDLWSGPRVRHFIKHRFGIEYHVKYMPRLLRRLGLEIKFPERRALEQDPKAVREWKNKRFPAIMDDARKRRALVFYADETLVSLIPTVGRTWTFPEICPIVRVSGKRGEHIGVTGAVNGGGRSFFELTREGEKFTSDVFIRFVKKLRKGFPYRPVILVVDGASPHKSKKTMSFVEDNPWLRLELLPAYSPEWNPSEKVWGHLKGRVRNGSQATDRDALLKETKDGLRRMKKKKELIKGFFG